MSFTKIMRDFCALMYEVFLAYTVLFIVDDMMEIDDLGLTHYFIILTAYSIMHLVREKTNKNLVIFPVGLLICVVLGLLPYGLFYKILFVGIGLFQLIASKVYIINKRKSKKIADKVVPVVILLAYSYFAGIGKDSMYLITGANVLSVTFIFIFFMGFYLEGAHDYLLCSKGLDEEKTKNMIMINSIIVVSIILLIILSICSNQDFGLRGLFNGIGQILRIICKGIMWVIYFIIYWFSRLLRVNHDPERVSGFQLPFTNDDSVYNSVIWTILKIVIVIAIGLLLLKTIARVLKYIMQSKNDDTDEYEKIEDKNITKTEKVSRKERSFHFAKTNREKIRKYYRKNIESYYKDVRLNNYLTCGEIKQKIAENASGDVSEITEIYKLARYSDKEISDELVKRAKRCRDR